MNLNFIQCDYKRGCQIVCAEGTIYWDFKERIVKLFGATGNIESQYEEPAEWQANQMYLDEMQHFLEAIKNGTPAFNPLEGRLDAL